MSSTTASLVWRNLNGTRSNFVRERAVIVSRAKGSTERQACRKRESVGHRFPTFLEKASVATPVFLCPHFPKSVEKSVEN